MRQLTCKVSALVMGISVAGYGWTQDGAAAKQAPAAGQDSLEEIVVTGTLLQSSDFRAPTPVQVVTAEAIEQRAPSNIADLVNEIPAFRISRSSKGSGRIADQQAGVQALLDLRGLDDVRTLVLINGHRHVGTVARGSFDTNLIPVGLIERVDVVTGGASAAYGSDAVAGVTNFILKNRMTGISGSVQSSTTDYGDGDEYMGTLAGGFGFSDDRGHVILGADYSKSKGVGSIYERPYGRLEPGLISRTGRPANEAAAVFANGVQIGTSTPGSLITTRLNGQLYTFDAAGNPAVFNQGTLYGANMVGSNANYGYNPNGPFQLQNENDRRVIYGRAEYDVTDTFKVFAETNYGRSHVPPTLTADYITSFRIASNNPFLPQSIRSMIPPATTSIQIGRINTDFGGNQTWQTNEVKRAVVGLEGQVFDDWAWQVYHQRGRTDQDFATSGLVLPALYKAVYGCDGTAANPNLATAALRAQVALYEQLSGKTCSVFNPIGIGNGSAAAYGYFLNDQTQATRIEQDVTSAGVSGSPFAIWAGDVSIAAGAEYRVDRLEVVADKLPLANLFTLGNFTSYGGRNTVKEVFTEIGVPLLQDAPLAKSVDLNGAVRRTDYKLSGLVTTWKAGLTYEPVDAIMFRVSKSRDIRAPNLNDLFFVGGSTTGTVTNNVPGAVGFGNTGTTTVAGFGNPDLVPEIADTFTGGVVVQIGSAFRAALDYYEIEVDGAIVRLNSQQTLNQCAAGLASACSAITFDNSVLGIASIINRSSNVNSLRVEGVDLQVAYRLQALPWSIPGSFEVSLLANRAIHNQLTSSLTGLTTENAGATTGLPKWTGNLTFGYDVGRLGVDLQFRGFSSSKYDPARVGPEDEGYVVTASNSISQNRFAGMVYTNLSMRYDIADKINVFAVVNNLTNREPPNYVITAVTTGNRQLNYDLIGREYKAGVRFSF